MVTTNYYDALCLFSGGLDSILAIKLLETQRLKIKALHYFSPFFGFPEKKAFWEKEYKLDLELIDISQDFINMLIQKPKYGFGKSLNPCVDCKILLLSHSKELLTTYNAKFLVTGEVLGQRPMSQRPDTLNAISRDAKVKDILLRPLSALCLPPSHMELSGLVKREYLADISGRGRKKQLLLAEKLNIKTFASPAGGCRLADKNNSKNYYLILKHFPKPTGNDFYLANSSRQYWSETMWLSIGRNKADNEKLETLAKSSDYLFKVVNFPSPLGLLRPLPNLNYTQNDIEKIAQFIASFSPKALASNTTVTILIKHQQKNYSINVLPDRQSEIAWLEFNLKEMKERCFSASTK